MTTLVRWEAVTRPRPFFRAFDRFFDDPFWPSPTVKSVNGGPRTPTLDMYEADEEVVVRTALPGVTPEDVQITIEDGYLEIRAQISSEVVDEKARWVRRELLSGDYGRKVALPTGLEHDRAEASYDHGILTLRIPKAESARPKQIKISAKSK